MIRIIFISLFVLAVTCQLDFQEDEDAECAAKMSAIRLVSKKALEEIRNLRKKVSEHEAMNKTEIDSLQKKVSQCKSAGNTAVKTLQMKISECESAKETDKKMMQNKISECENTKRKEMEILQNQVTQCENMSQKDNTVPVTTSPTNAPNGPVYESCKTKCFGGCFWVEVGTLRSTTFATAEEICRNHDSVVAVIPDESTYYAILDLSKTVAKNSGSLFKFNIWTAMNISYIKEGNSDSTNTFYKWFSDSYPSNNSEQTHVAIHITIDPIHNPEGMFNIPPNSKREGVVCWKPKITKRSSANKYPTNCYKEEDDGESYRGEVSETDNGIPCQNWNSQSPHQHTRTKEIFGEAALEKNFCRNPDSEERPWCFTTDPFVRWRHCNIPICADKTETDSAPLIQKGPVSNSCKTTCTGGCFWVEVHDSSSKFSFSAAKRICEAQDSVLAVIPDEKTYRDIVWTARLQGIVKNWDYFSMWTGMKLTNYVTKEIHTKEAYTKWRPGEPTDDNGYDHILILINKEADAKNQGMFNYPPYQKVVAVACWKPPF